MKTSCSRSQGSSGGLEGERSFICAKVELDQFPEAGVSQHLALVLVVPFFPVLQLAVLEMSAKKTCIWLQFVCCTLLQ